MINHFRQRRGALLTRAQFDAADSQTAARIAENGGSLRGRIRTMRWALARRPVMDHRGPRHLRGVDNAVDQAFVGAAPRVRGGAPGVADHQRRAAALARGAGQATSRWWRTELRELLDELESRFCRPRGENPRYPEVLE